MNENVFDVKEIVIKKKCLMLKDFFLRKALYRSLIVRKRKRTFICVFF